MDGLELGSTLGLDDGVLLGTDEGEKHVAKTRFTTIKFSLGSKVIT